MDLGRMREKDDAAPGGIALRARARSSLLK
jgi:hypothetical protein